MTDDWTFPFGQKVHGVVQMDCTPKRVFVLGVYASAVHAQWIGPNKKTVIKALAVASEPYIFWRGDNAEELIPQIPHALGMLRPANSQFNGPSGKALDEKILNPLGLNRSDAWLCDLVPHSCVNPGQKAAIEKYYLPIAKQHGLPEASAPGVPKILADETRKQKILEEIKESCAEVLIVLGDQPIKWLLRDFDPQGRRRLSDFEPYGKLHAMDIGDKPMNVLPLAHPRQISKLGKHSPVWCDRHEKWLNTDTSQILGVLI